MRLYSARPRLPFAAATAFLFTLGCSSSSTGPDGRLAGGTTHPAGTIASTLVITGRPHGVAIASNGRFCVSQIDAASITCGMLTAEGATVQSTTAVGETPAHVALSTDGTRAYTANQYGSSATMVDVSAATPTVLGTILLPSQGFNVLVDAASSRLYVTTSSGLLQIFDATTRAFIASVPVGANANGLALDRTAKILYVSSISAGTVTAVNTATNTATRTYTVSPTPQRIALSADGKTLYVANESTGLDMLDVTTGARISVNGVDPQAVGLALSPDGKVVYVTNPPRGKVQIVDLTTLQVTTLSGLGSPRNVAFGLSGAAAMVTGEANTVYVIR